MNEEELDKLMENYETTDLLDVINNGPFHLRDDVFSLHRFAMQVCNHGDTSSALEMFDLAEELESKLDDEIENMERLRDQISRLLELKPASLDEDEI